LKTSTIVDKVFEIPFVSGFKLDIRTHIPEIRRTKTAIKTRLVAARVVHVAAK
jgi:hypothetical protein